MESYMESAKPRGPRPSETRQSRRLCETASRRSDSNRLEATAGGFLYWYRIARGDRQVARPGRSAADVSCCSTCVGRVGNSQALECNGHSLCHFDVGHYGVEHGHALEVPQRTRMPRSHSTAPVRTSPSSPSASSASRGSSASLACVLALPKRPGGCGATSPATLRRRLPPPLLSAVGMQL